MATYIWAFRRGLCIPKPQAQQMPEQRIMGEHFIDQLRIDLSDIGIAILPFRLAILPVRRKPSFRHTMRQRPDLSHRLICPVAERQAKNHAHR